MFAGIEIASSLLEPAFWDTFLYGAMAVASAWLVGSLGPVLMWHLGSQGVLTVRGTLLAKAPTPDADVVEKISVALGIQGAGSDGERGSDSHTGDDGQAGRRDGVRRTGRPKRIWLCAGEEEPFLCWVTDRGRGGLGIVVDRLVPIGTLISVLPADAPAGTPPAELEVRNCRRKGNRWKLGCQFLGDDPPTLRLLLG